MNLSREQWANVCGLDLAEVEPEADAEVRLPGAEYQSDRLEAPRARLVFVSTGTLAMRHALAQLADADVRRPALAYPPLEGDA